MNMTMEEARDIGEMLDSMQLGANAGKFKFMVIGPPELRTEYLKDTESKPIMMGVHKLEFSGLKNKWRM